MYMLSCPSFLYFFNHSLSLAHPNPYPLILYLASVQQKVGEYAPACIAQLYAARDLFPTVSVLTPTHDVIVITRCEIAVMFMSIGVLTFCLSVCWLLTIYMYIDLCSLC